MHDISAADQNRLRELAKQQREIAVSPQMQNLRKEWTAHNDLKGQRPMITIETASFADDIMPPLLQCEGELARKYEYTLRCNIINHTVFGDDSIVRDYWPVGYYYWFKPFGLDIEVEREAGALGHHFVPQIEDFTADFHKLKKSTYGNDTEGHKNEIALINELFGDILPAKSVGRSLYTVLTQDLVHLMSMETMFFAMYDAPDLFHQAMEQLSGDYLELFAYLSKNGWLDSTTGDEPLAQGSYCFTGSLPKQKDGLFTPSDIWGFCDSQETVGVAPDMFEEFIWPYYKRIADSYGLLSYGCCEPTDSIWENCLSKLGNLRKVSISAWCNEEFMGERLRGTKTIFHRKPSPNFLGVGSGDLDETALREHIKKTLRAAAGCKIEFTQRDVYQVAGNPLKVKRFIDIIREECTNLY